MLNPSVRRMANVLGKASDAIEKSTELYVQTLQQKVPNMEMPDEMITRAISEPLGKISTSLVSMSSAVEDAVTK